MPEAACLCHPEQRGTYSLFLTLSSCLLTSHLSFPARKGQLKQRLAALVSWVDTHVALPAGRSATWAALDPHRHEPGFLGSIPYILVLRYLITFTVTVRLSAHRSEYTANQWSIRIIIITLIWLATLISTYVAVKPTLRRSRWIQAGTILADIVLISAAYQLTGQYQSDFFLFYYLPIFASVEYLGGWGAIAISLGVGLAMVMAVYFMRALQEASVTQWVPVLQVLLLRWFFLLAVGLTSAFVFRGLSRRQAQLLTLLEALHSGAAGIPDVQALEEALESILSELTEKLNFEFAAISLVDEYRNCIETVRGRNISPGWIMRDKHQLDERDIQTYVVMTGKTKVIAGWDDLLDKTIYERFEHWRLARVWAPIYSAAGLVVGTIEAGCDKERKDEVLTDLAIERVKRLGCEKGEEIARKRPQVLLQSMAKDAIELIGADSASLHVYRLTMSDSAAEEHEWGELILAAGAGKATPEFVQSYMPRPHGRDKKAIRTGEPVWIDDPRQFKNHYPRLYELGLRALAVIPLKLGPDMAGVLAIHSWQSGKKFTSREINLAETFAREMEGVIQNYLLLRRATEAGGRAWALSGLQSLMQSLTSPFNLRDVLENIAKNALLTLDADNVTLYEYHARENSFSIPPVLDGQFIHPDSMKADLSPDDVLFEFVRRGSSQFIVDVHNHKEPDLVAPPRSRKPRFGEREEIKSCAVLVLRSREEIVGLLYVNFRRVHNFSGEEKRAMDALSTSAALAIRNARLHQADINRQLEAMHSILAAIAEKGPDLKPVLERLLEQTLELTGAKYGVCMRWNEVTQVLEPIARWPARGDYSIESRVLGDGIIGLAAKSRRSILVEDVEDPHKSVFVETVGEVWPANIHKKTNPDTRSEIAVPLLDEGRLLGVLNIEHSEPQAFTQDDRVLLETLAVPAIIAFHTVELYKKLERRIRHLTALNLVAERVQANPYELGTVLRLFLTGITAGDGLGFSRAMVFLVDKDGQTLRGESAIGPVTEQQAKDGWERFEYGLPFYTSGLDFLLRQAEQFSGEIKEQKVSEDSPLSIAIRRESFSIDHMTGALAECFLTGKTITVEHDQPDPFRAALGRITQPDKVLHAFTAVPLVGKHTGRIGALVVDNRFLWKESAIDTEQIAGLEAFAGLLALSLENARLQQRLTEEQRVENWKEVTGSIAHSVGTLLFEVKGDVKELSYHLRELNEGIWRDVGNRLDELNNGISMAEKVLWNFRTFASPAPLEREHVDLRQIVKGVFQPVYGDCLTEISLPAKPLPVFADSFKLSNALREIRKNAEEAMLGVRDKPKIIEVTASMSTSAAADRTYAQLEIADNGPGFSNHVKDRLFQPYFTTKKDGSGLGLAIARKVITAHGGTLEADNSPDGGARFVVRIPAFMSPGNVTEGVNNG